MASSRRRPRSVRQSLARSTQARDSCSGYCSSLASSRSIRVKASAVAPAKPAITRPSARVRTLRALPLTTVWPCVTWPSPAMTLWPPLRTARMVVPCQSGKVLAVMGRRGRAQDPGSRWMSFSDEEVDRYARHLVLREIGGAGQQALKAASVLIVGAGGLGAPAAPYLGAAGVGRAKVEAAAERLTGLNPHVAIEPIAARLCSDNAAALVRPYDLVLDGTDDFATRFAVNDACLAEGKPLVSGAIGRWTGQVGVFAGRPCYRCLVPDIPPEAIKLITQAGDSLTGRLLIYDALSAETRTVRVGADPACPACG